MTAKKEPDPKVLDLSISQNGNAPDSSLIELDFPIVPLMKYNVLAHVLTVFGSLNGAVVNGIHETTITGDLVVSILFLIVGLNSL